MKPSTSFLEADERGLEATGLAREYLILYISLRPAVVTNQHCSQMRLLTAPGDDLSHFFGYLCLYGGCRCLSVNEFHIL